MPETTSILIPGKISILIVQLILEMEDPPPLILMENTMYLLEKFQGESVVLRGQIVMKHTLIQSFQLEIRQISQEKI